jgi:ankyrin repeat protein
MNGDLDAIRALQRAGVDYSKLRYQGVTALDYAKQSGDDELLELLTRKGHVL